jgi:hypothetical protein
VLAGPVPTAHRARCWRGVLLPLASPRAGRPSADGSSRKVLARRAGAAGPPQHGPQLPPSPATATCGRPPLVAAGVPAPPALPPPAGPRLLPFPAKP